MKNTIMFLIPIVPAILATGVLFFHLLASFFHRIKWSATSALRVSQILTALTIVFVTVQNRTHIPSTEELEQANSLAYALFAPVLAPFAILFGITLVTFSLLYPEAISALEYVCRFVANEAEYNTNKVNNERTRQ